MCSHKQGLHRTDLAAITHRGFGSGIRVWKSIPMIESGIKYRLRKLVGSPEQELERIHHCVKQQYSRWCDS